MLPEEVAGSVLAMARALAESGADIGLLDILPDVSETAAELGRETGVATAGVIADVRDSVAVESAVGTLQQQIRAPQTSLVTSAGITMWGERC